MPDGCLYKKIMKILNMNICDTLIDPREFYEAAFLFRLSKKDMRDLMREMKAEGKIDYEGEQPKRIKVNRAAMLA